MENYIYRKIVKETEKAYLVEQPINNRRGESGIKFKWIAKSICSGEIQTIKETGERFILCPDWIISNGCW